MACGDSMTSHDPEASHFAPMSAIRYDTIEEFNVDSKAKYTA